MIKLSFLLGVLQLLSCLSKFCAISNKHSITFRSVLSLPIGYFVLKLWYHIIHHFLFMCMYILPIRTIQFLVQYKVQFSGKTYGLQVVLAYDYLYKDRSKIMTIHKKTTHNVLVINLRYRPK